MSDIIDKLKQSTEPIIIAKLNKYILKSDDETNRKLSIDVKNSERIKKLLSVNDFIDYKEINPYQKYYGMHWVLPELADCEYPEGDEVLRAVCNYVCDFWLKEKSIEERTIEKLSKKYKRFPGVPIINGLARRCASQQGNALYSAVKLGFIDTRCDRLAELLIRWQWPDGGWNCDRKYEAVNSSFMETLIPMRGLYFYGKKAGNSDAVIAAKRAADIFLKRNMYKRRSTGEAINEDFTKLHYPCYWHYDILFGLKVMCEMGLINDPRCSDALDLLESKQLGDGGFPAERKFYRAFDVPTKGGTLAEWGGTSKKRYNEFVSVDAIRVLKDAGRM